MRGLLLVAVALVGCSETSIGRGRLPDPAEPPERELDLWGTPPSNWNDCYGGLRGLYYNLTPEHPDVEPDLDPAAPPDERGLDDLDWWEGDLAFQRYDGTTDFGRNWWPVDGGFAGDPQHFTARWIGWIRVTDRGDHDMVFAASTDAFVKLDDEVILELRDQDESVTVTETVNLQSGVYKLDLRYAHRYGETNGFRFRVASDDIIVCYPEFGDDPEE